MPSSVYSRSILSVTGTTGSVVKSWLLASSSTATPVNIPSPGAVELDAGDRIFTTLPVMPVSQGRGGETTLDFAHFANGTGITSSLVFVNVSGPRRVGPFTLAGQPIRPALYFYDQGGNLIDPESVVDLTGDLEVTEDGALTVQTELGPLEELTI